MAVQIHLDYPPLTRQGNTCSACGAGHRQIRDDGARTARPERIVDFFINIDFEGFLMLCEQCVLEAAAMLGWVSPVERDRALTAAAQSDADLAKMTAERDEAVALLDALRFYDQRLAVSAEPVQEVVEVVEPEPEPEPVRKTKPRARKAKITA